MGSLKLNLADIPTNNLTLGDHDVIIQTVTHAENAARDGFNLIWEIDFVDGLDAGKTARTWSSLKPTALGMLVDRLKAIGVLAEDATAGELDIEWEEETGLVYQPELADLPARVRVSLQNPKDPKSRQNIDFISSTVAAVAPSSNGSARPKLR